MNGIKQQSILIVNATRLAAAILFVGSLVAIEPTPVCGQKATIELEIFMANAGLDDQQKWGQLLADVGADSYKLKTARGNVEITVEESNYGRGDHYRVIGVLSGNRLELPGGSFTSREKAKIKALLQKIRDDGPNTALSEKLAFGLTAEQLVSLQQDLAKKHSTSTKDKKVLEIVKAIAASVKTPIHIHESARKALAENDQVPEEMDTLTSGTTLAAVLRPIGLVAVPKRDQGKEIEIFIVDSKKADEHWPVGWPVEGSNLSAVPGMFKKEKADIENFKLKDVLDIIEQTCKVPFLYDHNSMARHGADMDKLTVTYKQQPTAYFSIMTRLLAQVRPQMKMEVRLDEVGTPFIWITTMRK